MNKNCVRVLCIGDVFGRPGRRIIKEKLPELIAERSIDFVVANGENAAGGKGLNQKCADELFAAGVDVLTNGNHLLDNKDIIPMLEIDRRLLRPWNMKDSVPGRGFTVIKKQGVPFAVANFMGTILMHHQESPFAKLDQHVAMLQDQAKVCIVDMHAEATSEMRVMGHYLNGKVSVVFGTHTHVPTADHEILDQGTAYITDVGMTGPYDSVIGVKKEFAMHRIMTGERNGYEVAKDNVKLFGLLCEIDPDTGKTVRIEQIKVGL
ncbi:MAG: TIGR00282 family metallophosphoesterase [Bdellovibrionota bacterium]